MHMVQDANTRKVVILSPTLSAVSGVSTHVNLLVESALSGEFSFLHFQVGSEGRAETGLRKAARLMASPFRLATLIIRDRPAIVHINTAMNPKGYWRDIWYLAIAHLLGCKVVFQVHGGELPTEIFAGRKVLTSLLRRVLCTADAVVLLSRVEEKAYRTLAPRARVELIANAIDPDRLAAADPCKASRGHPLHLAYLGRLIQSKGLLEIVEATRILHGRGIAVRVTIAGSGPLETRLRELVARARLTQHVTFAGALSGDAKDTLWREADLFVLPTYHKEGLPYALLEAMAAGAVPVVTSEGGIPDVLEDGVHGLMVPAQDPAALAAAIARLDADRPLIARMAIAGRRRVFENYALSRLVNDFRSLYKALINDVD
jgi:glycosyltransferase involved in cell wall biosynthesis